MEVELDWLCNVVRRHCPAFFLHPSDRYLPCSMEFFMKHSELRMLDHDGATRVLLPRGSVAGPLLVEAQQAQRGGQLPGSRLWLELDPAARTGEPLERLDEVPVYAHAKQVVAHDGSVEAIEIVYITMYAYNGAYRVGGLPFIQTGAHDGDIEHLTVRVHPTSGALQGVWYNAHRSRDGSWVAAHQVPRDPHSGRIAAYVAYHGHGTYPAPGRVLRHFLLGNDLCSSKGPVWRPRQVVMLPPLHETSTPAAIQAAKEAAVAAAAEAVPAAIPTATEAAVAAEDGGGNGTRRWALMQAPSRGSCLPPALEERMVPVLVERSGSGNGAAEGGTEWPRVCTDACCAWLAFEGQWGQTVAPAQQQWFYRAEPPVSRSPLLRVVGHTWPEPH